MKLLIDFGGTHFRYQLLENDQIIKEEVLPSTNISLIDFLEEKIIKYPKITFIGIAFGGQVDNGVILSAPNIAIDQLNIKSYIESKYPVRLEIDNDLKVASLAESEHLGKDKSFILLYMGTGLGSAFVEKGKLIRGHNNLAGEIGHIPYKEAPFACGCGKYDCLELYCSGSGIQKWINYHGLKTKPTLQALKDDQDEASQQILNNFHQGLIFASSMLVTLLNPQYLVLGGGVFMKNPYLKDIIQKGFLNHALAKSADTTKVKISTYENANLIGAKLLEYYKGNI